MSHTKPGNKSRLRKLAVALIWLVVWQGVALLVKKPVLFASPLDTLKALLALLPTAAFWQTVLHSFVRIALGFLLALVLGVAVGTLSWRVRFVQELLSPLLVFMKSVPVASFVILVLVWFGSKSLSVIVAFLIVFPLIYFATLAGLKSADPQLLEMARVFRVRPLRKAWDIYRPALLPYLLPACTSALGMSWKSGVAAEVIGTPLHSIGEQLYLSKVYMVTADLFAWTLVVIALSIAFEKAVLAVLRKVGGNGHRA